MVCQDETARRQRAPGRSPEARDYNRWSHHNLQAGGGTNIHTTLTSKDGTKGAMLLDVLSSDKAHSRTAHVDALVRIAIVCDDLRDMKSTTTKIRAGGKYRGVKRAKGDIAESEGYARFDPAQSGLDTANRWWKALLELLEAYFGQQHASTAEQTAAEVNWRYGGQRSYLENRKGLSCSCA